VEQTAFLRGLPINKYYWSNKIKKTVRWEGNLARVGERRGAFRVLVRKHEGKKPLRRSRRRWEGNIKTGS